ncbi:hypothetical protein POM88_042533 [Heracleum sosnowskyi]|uniref:Protein kinase domain-containing protein n=1 Tax=Heracleum sosnowskyi TaxID=360622 RepID=A0AAD8HIS3_9APIA|nr:hypothetical protein POM88_042533 [Heracleum sosnowskyi]
MISGILPPEISDAINLVKIDLSNNLLSDPVPSEIGNLKRLNFLVFQGNKFNLATKKRKKNKFNSSVPETLYVLDLSSNLLKGLDSNLLVYEYMPNGNLLDSLHKGKVLLDWPTRHQIALDVAQGLANLHHDLVPSIIHRDISS